MDELAQTTGREMATELGNYLLTIPEESMQLRHPEIKTKAMEIAKRALQKQPLILGTGVAAASVQVAIVQFQNAVIRSAEHWEESQKRREFLAAYWRVMGAAWNRTGDSEQWGFPFRDCGPLKQRWLWPYTATIQVARFKIVTALFIPADTDPCTQSAVLAQEIYGRRRQSPCNTWTEICSPLPGPGDRSFAARTDLFACDCRPGFVRTAVEDPPNNSSNRSSSNNDNNLMDNEYNNATPPQPPCIPCHQASVDVQLKNAASCNSSVNANPVGGHGENLNGNLELLLSEVEEVAALSLESLMNATIGAILGSCMVTSLGLGMIVYRKRKFKTIAMGMWTILETIIVGIVIMYSAVLLHFLEASTMRCLLEPWFRELGFVICYGAITLKLYRHLIEFRTRKAHRCVVRDVDLLKYLCAMVVAVLCYLSAFTASSLDFVEHSQLDGLSVENNLCRPLKWDYVTEAGEMAILLFGLYLSYISRNAKTMFQVRLLFVLLIHGDGDDDDD